MGYPGSDGSKNQAEKSRAVFKTKNKKKTEEGKKERGNKVPSFLTGKKPFFGTDTTTKDHHRRVDRRKKSK